MDDSKAPSARRDESSRRSSLQRTRPGPRGRNSSQSLHSNGRPEATTFTSFKPFSPPLRRVVPVPNLDGYPESPDSNSSSKRSRSIYAPNRQNSIGEQTPQVKASLTQQNTNLSLASKSLMSAMIDTEEPEDPLFTDPDLQHYRTCPTVLSHANDETLYRLAERHTVWKIIRSLAADLEHRDAEVAGMRQRTEEMANLFADHLSTVHHLSRPEADKTVRNLTAPIHPYDNMATRLEDAYTSPLSETHGDASSDGHILASNDSLPSGRTLEQTASGPAKTENAKPIDITPSRGSTGTLRGGVFSMFAGKKDKRQPIAGVSALNAAKAAADYRRRSSVDSASLKGTFLSLAGPVEMTSIVETENLPPPLITPRAVKALYPTHMADVYGFIIDVPRILDYYRKDDPVNWPNFQATRAGRADTLVSRPSSVSSIKEDEELAEGEEQEPETTPWTSYLKFEGYSFTSSFWLPVALLPGPRTHEEPGVESPVGSPPRVTDTEAATSLQKQLALHYDTFQGARTILWERFLTVDKQDKDGGTAFILPNWLRPGQPSATRQSLTTVEANLPDDLSKERRLERTRLVLGGVSMQLRSKVWSQYANEMMIHEPDEYGNLAPNASQSIDSRTLSEIDDDIPRTLANNVFFRSGRGRHALRELLCTFVVKKPEIGYCQGMNLIGGYLLLALPTTETAFWIFCYMIEHVLTETYFDATMRGASIEIAVLRSYVRDLIPRLAKHFDDLDIADQETVPYNWFLTAFASTLTIEALYRVWDVVLGLPTQKNFLLRIAIAILKVNEASLLLIGDSFALRDYLDRSMAGPSVSIDNLIKASSKLGSVMKDEEVRKRRRHFAFKVDDG